MRMEGGGRMTDLTTLIAKLEAATGPDRELDAEIMFDMFASPVGHSKIDGGPIGYIRLDDRPSWNLGIRFPGKDREWVASTRKRIKGETLIIERDGAYVLMNSIRVEEFTKSIDAAVALAERVLPGFVFAHIGQDYLSTDNGYNPIGWTVEIVNGVRFQGQAQSLPIALVIAILRAKQAKERP